MTKQEAETFVLAAFKILKRGVTNRNKRDICDAYDMITENDTFEWYMVDDDLYNHWDAWSEAANDILLN